MCLSVYLEKSRESWWASALHGAALTLSRTHAHAQAQAQAQGRTHAQGPLRGNPPLFPLSGDAEIDTTKVDSTRSMYEYDGETQGAIRKILFDQDQKRKGQPTSDEMQNEELLRRAWDAEGSPFRGTPYDPSKVSLSQGGSET